MGLPQMIEAGLEAGLYPSLLFLVRTLRQCRSCGCLRILARAAIAQDVRCSLAGLRTGVFVLGHDQYSLAGAMFFDTLIA